MNIIREPINTNKKYNIQEFRDYMNTSNTDKIIIFHKNNPAVYDISKIKQALINKGFYDKSHYFFQFNLEKGTLTITK